MLVSGSDLPAWIQNFVLPFAENGVDFEESSVFGRYTSHITFSKVIKTVKVVTYHPI